MYSILKATQVEINTALLKMADDFLKLGEDRGHVEPVLTENAHPAQLQLQHSAQLQEMSNTIAYIHQKQNAQFATMIQEVQRLSSNFKDLTDTIKSLIEQKNSVEAVTTIPSLQHTAHVSELKEVYVVSNADNTSVSDTPVSNLGDNITPDTYMDEEVSEEEFSEEVDLEVEEWTYKGNLFFKDSENTVYTNNKGEIGDPIGQYDPVKKIVKKLPTN